MEVINLKHNIEMENEKRTEYVGVYLTPEMARELRLATSNEELQNSIIKRYIKGETDFINQEIKAIDETVLRYRAKLLTIKDAFVEVQDSYVNEIESLFEKTEKTFNPIKLKFTELSKEIERFKRDANAISTDLKDISTKFNYLDSSRLDIFINSIERFNKMSESEKELILKLLNK